jgi:CheY-like chemotaxis protein
MDIFKALDALEKIERDASDLYKKLHRDYCENKEAAQFFYNLHLEAEGHAQIVRMERRIVQSSPREFGEPQINFSEINSLLEKIDALKTYTLELPELISQIYSIENSLAKKYLIDAIKNTNDAFHDFLMQLGDTCNIHLRMVAAFAAKMGVNIKNVQNRYQRKTRVSFDDTVMINGAMRVRGVDISEGGMFLLTGRTFRTGASLTIQFNALEVPITTDAEVQFIVDGIGMGVRFKGLFEADRELIARFVTQRIEDKGLKKQKRVLLVGCPGLAARDMRVYVHNLISSGFRVVDVSNFDDAVSSLRKKLQLSCIILSIEHELDANCFLLSVLPSLGPYNNLPIVVLTNNAHKEFRELLIKNRVRRLLNRMSTPPKRLAEEIKAVTENTGPPLTPSSMVFKRKGFKALTAEGMIIDR